MMGEENVKSLFYDIAKLAIENNRCFHVELKNVKNLFADGREFRDDGLVMRVFEQEQEIVEEV